MSNFGSIALWGFIAGLVIGLAILFLAPVETRAKVETQLLRFGSGGALFLFVWWFIITGRASAQAEFAIGVVVLGSLVAGVALAIARRLNGRG